MQTAEEEQAKLRFAAIVRVIVGTERLHHADRLKVSEATIRNWIHDKHIPRSPAERGRVLRILGEPPEALNYDEARWNAYYKELSSRQPDLDPPDGQHAWLYYSADVLRVERAIGRVERAVGPGACVILMTSEADEDTSSRAVRELVSGNVVKGINYLYVIPHDCRKRDDLIRFARTVGKTGAAGHGVINVMIVHAGSQAIEWLLTDYIWFATKPGFVPTKERMGNIEADDIEMTLEQLYKSSDLLPGNVPATPHRRVWTVASHRRQAIFLDMMRSWSAKAEWI